MPGDLQERAAGSTTRLQSAAWDLSSNHGDGDWRCGGGSGFVRRRHYDRIRSWAEDRERPYEIYQLFLFFVSIYSKSLLYSFFSKTYRNTEIKLAL
jgi:hypothetical protein